MILGQKKTCKKTFNVFSVFKCLSSIIEKDGVIEFKTDNRGLFEYSLQSVTENNYHLDYVSLDLHNSQTDDNIMTEYEENFQNGPIINDY
ncbi:MAG: hypothetical protein ACLS85_02065 [Coprobacillus cateniformis]